MNNEIKKLSVDELMQARPHTFARAAIGARRMAARQPTARQ